MTFGEKLKELRRRKGMTQASLAESSTIPLGTIRDYEQGKRNPKLYNAQKLAHALGVSLEAFPRALEPVPSPTQKRPRHRPPKASPPAGAEGTAATKRRRPRKRT